MTGKDTLGDMPIEEKHRAYMNSLARALDQLLNPGLRGANRKTGFCLMLFDFGSGPGRANYISNADRDNVIVLLREQLKRFEEYEAAEAAKGSN